MNRDEFLNIIKEGLKDFPEMELNDILYDYKEHFDAALASGKSNEEIILELGNPEDLVNQYRSGYLQKYEVPKSDNYNRTNSSSYDNSSNYTSSKDTKNNNSNYARNTNKVNSSEDTTSQIIKLVLLICGIIFLGPIASGLVIGVFGVFIGFTGLFFGITVGGIGILLGTTFTSVLGIVSIPAFIIEFPTAVIVLFTIGGFLGFIFNIMIIYYLIKLFIRLVKRFINWVSPKIRGEK